MAENMLHRVTLTDGTEKLVDGAVEFIDLAAIVRGDLSKIEKIERVPRSRDPFTLTEEEYLALAEHPRSSPQRVLLGLVIDHFAAQGRRSP